MASPQAFAAAKNEDNKQADEFTTVAPIIADKKSEEKKKDEQPSIEEEDNYSGGIDDFVLDEDNISLDYGDIK